MKVSCFRSDKIGRGENVRRIAAVVKISTLDTIVGSSAAEVCYFHSERRPRRGYKKCGCDVPWYCYRLYRRIC